MPSPHQRRHRRVIIDARQYADYHRLPIPYVFPGVLVTPSSLIGSCRTLLSWLREICWRRDDLSRAAGFIADAIRADGFSL